MTARRSPGGRHAGPRVGAALALAAVLALPATAGAHTELRASTPADGARLRAVPPALTLTFTAPLGRAETATVAGPGGEAAAPVRTDPRDARRMRVTLPDAGPGAYRVRWTARASDGHLMGGTVAFRVAGAPWDGPMRAVRAAAAAAGDAGRAVRAAAAG